MKSIEKLQNLIPLGYLFLVVMGILKESVYFYQLKINILKYSTIMDILISPIADLTANPLILFFIILFLFLITLVLVLIYNYRSTNWVRKKFNLNDNEPSTDIIKSKLKKAFLLAVSTGILSFFLGIGLGGGKNMAQKIKNNKLEYKQKLTFNTGETENIFLIDANSAYYFYLTAKSKSIKIAPIGAIKTIELEN